MHHQRLRPCPSPPLFAFLCGRLGEYGRLGHGNEHNLSRPTLVESLVGERITQIAAGQAHSVAVSWMGEASTWGWGFGFVLGHGDELDRLEPTKLSIPPDRGEPNVGRPAIAGAGMVGGGGGGGSGGGRAEVVGARGRRVVAVDDRVACATAGKQCTVLGTRRGRVLLTGLMHVCGDEGRCIRSAISTALSEFGRVARGCWRVQCSPSLGRHSNLETMLVIDSAGQAHELNEIEIEIDSSRGQRRLKRQRVPSGGNFGSCGGSSRGGAGTEPDPVEMAPWMTPPLRQLRVAPPFAKVSSVLVSPAIKDSCLSWAVNGSLGRCNGEVYVAVASDGYLLSSARTGEAPSKLQRGTADGLLHASVWVDDCGENARALLLVDGGASVVTHGSGRTGHVSSRGAGECFVTLSACCGCCCCHVRFCCL